MKTMSPLLRKLVLVAHVTFSVGWLGAVAAFIPLAVAGITSHDAQTVRAAYIAMGVIANFVIVPFSIASLITGLILSFGTKWGLFRHYWIIAKLSINVLSAIILQIHMQPIDFMARIASETTLAQTDDVQQRLQLVVAASASLVALLVATTLAVYKPRGLTPYGRRRQDEMRIVPGK